MVGQKRIVSVGCNRSYVQTWQSPDLPAPTILTATDQEGGAGWIEEDVPLGHDRTGPMPTMTDATVVSYMVDTSKEDGPEAAKEKPAYRVPSMAEINAIEWNGLKVVSTFSGAGGSCLGYRMAGCRIVWANEFIHIAQESYKANASPDCILDGRDIKLVQPEDILRATGLSQGELDIFDGSPPCQAFSTAGKREKGWGKEKSYEHGAKQCNETLFSEYIRLLRGIMPRAFVAENVSGLVKGTAKGYFLEILRELKASGYRVTAKVLDAQWLGVPQSRQRLIFVGLREDLNVEPTHPRPLPYFYSVRNALPEIVRVRASPHGPNSWDNDALHEDRPAPSLPASGADSGSYYAHNVSKSDDSAETAGERRKFTIAELRRICSFPDDFVLCGSYSQQWERLGNSVPPIMMRAIARELVAALRGCVA